MDNSKYLHHQEQRVEYNQQHYKIIEWLRYNDTPDFVFCLLLHWRNIRSKWSSIDGKIDARFLEKNTKDFKLKGFRFFANIF